MSGEGAVGVSVVAVVGGSVWLAARGVQATALVAARTVELAGDAMVRVGERAEQDRVRWEAERAGLLDWEAAARQVIGVNARLEVLRCAVPPDLAARLPASLRPCAETPAEMSTWCALTEAALARVESELLRRSSAAMLSVLRTGTTRQVPLSAREALARYAATLAAPVAPGTPTPKEITAAVTRIVGRLSADVSIEDRAAVLAAAADVVDPHGADESTLLVELRLRVQRAEDGARSMRADAVRAATVLQALEGDDPADPDLPGLRSALREVVARRHGLDPELSGRADRAVARVRERFEQDYVRTSVVDTLAGLGYDVDEGFATVTAGSMRLVRPEWAGHAVQVVVRGEEVKAAVVRLQDRAGSDARREDTEREVQWCGDLEELERSLARIGVAVVRRRLTPPGDKPLPVVARTRGRGADRAQLNAKVRER